MRGNKHIKYNEHMNSIIKKMRILLIKHNCNFQLDQIIRISVSQR